MDNNGMFSNTPGGSGMLGLEMSLNHQQTPNFLHHQQPPFSAVAPSKQPYPYPPKQRASPISDEECNNPTTTDDSGGGDGKFRKGSSPWQRMKWTDNMVRLLIMVVFYIGDEVGSDQAPGSDITMKKKAATGAGVAGAGVAGAGGGVLQKKGKWKSVSRAMMERGFNVSPQQCEDKFNDLNKRYKRVNDILGKGTACKVVENQSLLETMDHIPAKLKEEAKKLLNSKHLFFREMCAYHNSCATATTGGGSGVGGSGVAVPHAIQSPPPEATANNEQPPQQKQKCVHSNDEDEDIDNESEDEDEDGGDGNRYQREEEEDDGLSHRKRVRTAENEGVMQQFNSDVSCVIQDLTKSVWEKRQWVKMKMMQLEEQRVGFEGEAYELEKRRLRWVKFCSSREREMEMERLRNERMKLENERMGLLLRQKEMELLDLQ